MNDKLEHAHTFCSNNKNDLLKDSLCGCFYCLEIYNPKEIREWIDEDDKTALCAHCGIDSVISESSGYPITKEFLTEMRKYWFDE